MSTFSDTVSPIHADKTENEFIKFNSKTEENIDGDNETFKRDVEAGYNKKESKRLYGMKMIACLHSTTIVLKPHLYNPITVTLVF